MLPRRPGLGPTTSEDASLHVTFTRLDRRDVTAKNTATRHYRSVRRLSAQDRSVSEGGKQNAFAP